MLLEADPQSFDAGIDIRAVHLRCEALVFQFLLHARRVQRANTIWADEAAGHDETRELVAGEQGLVEGRSRLDPPRGEVYRDGVGDLRFPLLIKPIADQTRGLLGPLVV